MINPPAALGRKWHAEFDCYLYVALRFEKDLVRIHVEGVQ